MIIYLYLKEHSLSREDFARFRATLNSLGVTLEFIDVPDGKQIRLISPVGADSIRVRTSGERVANVEHACRSFGFEVTREQPPAPTAGPAQQQWD